MIRDAPPFVCPVCGPAAASSAAPPRALPAGLAVVTCPQCGIEWQWPRPPEAELAVLYGETYYEPWGLADDEQRVRAMKVATFERLLRRVESYRAPGRLLDVGCATGFLLEVAERRGWESHGIEVSSYSSGVARERFGEARVRTGELAHAELAPGAFRAVTMTDLIEHVVDPMATLRAAHAALERDGLLCLTTPRVGGASHRAMGRRWTHYKREHLQYFSPDAVRRLLGAADFRVLECRSWPKTLTFDYACGQFTRYRHWLVSPLVEALRHLLPAGVRSRHFALPLGDMLVIAARCN